MYKLKIFLISLALLCALTFIGCGENATLEFSKVSFDVTEGDSFELEPKIGNLIDGIIEYSFDKDGVIELKEGNEFIAKAEGTVTIKATIKGIDYLSVDITVNVKKKPTLEFSKVSFDVYEDDTFVLEPKVGNLTDASIEYSFDKEGIVELKEGNEFIAKSEGIVIITATIKGINNVSALITVNVSKKILVNEILVNCDETISIGEERELYITVLPENAFNKEFTVVSSDDSVIKVVLSEDGKYHLCSLKEGNAVITITALDGSNVEKTLEMSSEYKLSLQGSETILKDESESLVVNGILEGDFEKLIWSSSDDNIVTVVNGVITGKSAGTAIITCKLNDVEATITVKVELKKFVVKFIGFDGTTVISEQEVFDGDNALAPNAPIVDGYVFDGYSSSYENVNSDLTINLLYAKKLNITYELDGGTIPEDSQTYFVSGHEFILPLAQKNKCEFLGWSLSESSNEIITSIPETQTEDITLYAKYKDVTSYSITYDFNEGYTEELYSEKGKLITTISCDNYNYNKGAFWAGTNYASYIFLGDSSNDPSALFSDRIYIGKDINSGLYKIVDVVTSGKYSWPDGAEYLITISNSYKTWSAAHKLVTLLEKGDVVVFDKDLSSNSVTTPINVKFYENDLTNYELNSKIEKDGTLLSPMRVGYIFLGWFDENDKKYDTFDDFEKNITIKAKWEALTSVTDITIEKVITEMLTGEEFKLNAKVYPTDAYFQEIYYETSNRDVIEVTSDGLLKALSYGDATITLTDYVKNVTKVLNITVYPVTSIDASFTSDFNGTLKINETVQIKAEAYGKNVSDTEFVYTSSKSDVATVDSKGLITAIGLGTCEITISDKNNMFTPLTICVVVRELSDEDRLDKVIELLVENNFSVVQTGNACLYWDGSSKSTYYDSVYGSVNNYLFDEFVINRSYEETAVNNTSGHKSRRAADTIEFVTVHDTATLTGTSENIAKNMATGKTSIHYTVGNDVIYSVVPEKYIAYHAGDGTGTVFEWLVSGITATSSEKPDIKIAKSNGKWYFTINGQMTSLEAPITNGSKTISNPSNDNLPATGPVWKIENGQYYLGTAWANFDQNINGVICNKGGNCNSIGIEMNVNMTNDTYDTWQRTARLVADILIRNKLDTTRVMMHNNWSGKNCPQVFLTGNYWEYFMDMVELNYVLAKDYSDIEISMVSNNPDILDNTGRIYNAPVKTQTVSYTITVKNGELNKSITLYSVVPGSTTWEHWNGLYPSLRLWNNGNFLVK